MNQRVWARIAVWVVLFLVLYLLRAFTPLIFLTFVFTYIQVQGVNRLAHAIQSRILRTVLVGVLFVTIFICVGMFLVPRLSFEAGQFVERFPQYLKALDSELVTLSKNYSALEPLLGEKFHAQAGEHASAEWSISDSPTVTLVQSLLGSGEADAGAQSLRAVTESLARVGGILLASGSAFFLAIIFSFLIILDLPSLTTGIRRLKDSKVSWIYNEVSPSIRDFAVVLGRALQAQLGIAVLNTLFTAPGLLLMGLGDKVVFLSVIVFLCSFIPVAGVFISSAPICLIALQTGGWQLALVAVGYITLIHMIEAYILNPRIYGHHLHLNPVIVLIILTIGGKLFGVWGLLLGVPTCSYLYRVLVGTGHAR